MNFAIKLKKKRERNPNSKWKMSHFEKKDDIFLDLLVDDGEHEVNH
jgi:hypothetical protein